MRKFLYLLVFVVVFALGLTFAGHHAEPAVIDYHFGKLSMPLSLLLVLVLLVGTAIGLFASLSTVLKIKRENSKLRKSIQWVERENADLRAAAIKHE